MALIGGEALEAHVEAEHEGSVTVTGQGPGSVLKSDSVARQSWRFDVHDSADVTFLPWGTIPFPGSRSDASVEVALGHQASFIGWETLSIGRVGRGERFVFTEMRSSYRVSTPRGLVLDDRLCVYGDDSRWAEIAMGGHSHLGSLFVAGAAAEAISTQQMRDEVRGDLERVGVSRPSPDLVAVRALDRSLDRIEQAFWPLVEIARTAMALPLLHPQDVGRRWFPPEEDDVNVGGTDETDAR